MSRRRPCPTQETQITIKYGISTFMSKYFIFALYLPLFQLILDVFILNTQELVFGWKVYDYVSYQRYRFSVRDQRCVARRFEVLRGAFTPSTRSEPVPLMDHASRIHEARAPEHRRHAQVDDEQQGPGRVDRGIFTNVRFDVLLGAVLLLSRAHLVSACCW